MRMATSSKRPEKNEEESATLPALTVEGDCVLDFCLERDSYDSGYCKTNEVFPELINGQPGSEEDGRSSPLSIKVSLMHDNRMT